MPQRTDTGAVTEGLRRWLGSGALNSPAGAFCAWKDADTGVLAFEYPEITGYALTHLAQLELTEPEHQAGARAAQWLGDRLSSNGLAARGKWDGAAIYNFDLAMIASGLMSFGRRVDKPGIAASGEKLAEDLCAQHRSEGVLPSIRASAQRPSARSAWSTEGFAHLVKAAQCLLLHGGEEPRIVAGEIIALSTRQQQDDGRFVTHPSDSETMLHPHLYAIEGLWMYAEATGDQEARQRAGAGTHWAWDQQLSTGGFPRLKPTSAAEEEAPEQFDVTSQALRMAGLLDLELDGQAAAADRLAEVAKPDGDGAFALPYQAVDGASHLNAWASMFGFQALRVAREGSGALAWSHLV